MSIYYFDNAATTQLDKAVLEEMLPILKNEYGNPSSIYSIGRSAKTFLENSREKIASLLNCKPSEIYFTSGGSEADNAAIFGISAASGKKNIVTSTIEHPAVLNSVKSAAIGNKKCKFITATANGCIDVNIANELVSSDTGLVSTMLVNNETGVIQPIDELSEIAHSAGAYIHTDAVQSASCKKIDLQKLNVDSLSLSAHKFGGPKGIGILFLRTGTPFEKFIHGGHQERDRRAGTENIAFAAGCAKALELTYNNFDENNAQITALRQRFETAIKSDFSDVIINGESARRSCSISSVTFPGISADSIIMNLDFAGICISAGSACASGSVTPSHVLTAMGISDENAKSSVRVSFGKSNTPSETDFLIKTLTETVKRLKNI